MEPAKIDWKRIESKFIHDELYERINAPKWVDLSAPDQPVVDDETWFCRPDCRHPKTAEDYRRMSPSLKMKHLPLGERNGNRRDGNLKRRGGIAALLSSSSFREAPKAKLTSMKFNEDLENQDPNLCDKNAIAPPASCSKAMPKILKEGIKSSSEKNKEEVGDEWGQKKPAPRLRSTLSARNLFAGKDILGQISEFCQEIKKLIVMKEGSSATQEAVKKEELEVVKKKVLEEAPKSLNINSNMDGKRKGGLVRKSGMMLKVGKMEEKCKKNDDENSPLLKKEAAVRSCPPTPQRFPSPATRRLKSTKPAAAAAASSPLISTTPQRGGILRELVQSSDEKKPLGAMDENSTPVSDETEGKSLDVFWFLKPCSYLSK